MVRSIVLAAAVVFSQAPCASAGHGAEGKTQLVAREIQSAERLISAALRVGDYVELHRQSVELMQFFRQIPDTEEQAARYHCTAALQSLRNLADDRSYPNEARKILAGDRSQQSYLEHMPLCEAETALQETAAPNLRPPLSK